MWWVLLPSLLVMSEGATVCSVDVMLVLDGSSSITSSQFNEMIRFCSNVVSTADVSEDGAHIGVVQFSSTSASRLELSLTGDTSKAESTIEGIKQAGGSTDTARGLTLTLNEITANGRSKVASVVILVTDGKANAGSKPVPVAEQLKANGSTIIGIGVGSGADMQQIAQIASAPSSEYVIALQNFDDLASILASIVAKTCVAVTSITPDNGPSAGGTAVKVAGEGFVSSPNMKCRFGNATVPVVAFVSDAEVACRSPPRDLAGGDSVVVTFASDGVSFARSEAIFYYKGCPTPDCDGHGVCAGNKCVCDDGWTGDNCDKPVTPPPPPPPPCPKDCCQHGQCNHTTGTCMCDTGYVGADCCSQRIMCCQYCIPDPNNPGHYKPASHLAECWQGFCPGRFPAVIVDQWQVNTTDGMDGCIFNQHPQTNRPCIQDYGYCK